MSVRPEVGDRVQVISDLPAEEHIGTVTELLSTQFIAKYEWRRPDGGWVGRTLYLHLNGEGSQWRHFKS